MSNREEVALPGWVTLVHACSRVLGVAAAGLILLAVVVVCQMVFTRAVLGQSSIWQTEFATFSVIAATFIGAPYILLTHGHVGVDLLPMLVTGKVRFGLYLSGSFLALLFCALFLYAAIPWWYEAWHSGQKTASIWRATLWIPYLAVPVGLGLLCLQFLADIWLVLSARKTPFGLAPEEHL